MNPGDILDNRYEIVAPLGAGGMGAVFKAVHTHLGAPRVIKVIHANISGSADAKDRFLAMLDRLPWRTDPGVEEAMKAAARELLLLQASDWQFVVSTKGAVDAIREVGPRGHFFGAAHTQSRYETAFYEPFLSDWRNYEAWSAAGSVQTPLVS